MAFDVLHATLIIQFNILLFSLFVSCLSIILFHMGTLSRDCFRHTYCATSGVTVGFYAGFMRLQTAGILNPFLVLNRRSAGRATEESSLTSAGENET